MRYLLILLVVISACRTDQKVVPLNETRVADPDPIGANFYLLNEGNMGMNLSTLDYLDKKAGVYKSNIYGEVNPGVVKELGDAGNDLKIYGSKLYAVINQSNKVEVMEATTAKRIGIITIPNCRNIIFYKGKGYVTSFDGAGYVAEIDTTTLTVLRKTTVGRQPEEMAIIGDKMYVANSGGYSPSNYDRTVSVVDMNSFTQIRQIDVAINLHRIRPDAYGDLYVTSRGDYYNIPSKLYVIDSHTDAVKDSFNTGVTNLCIKGDSAYVFGVQYSYITNTNTVTYGIINVKTEAIINTAFITDGTDKQIKVPYGLAIDPVTSDIYVTDAKNYILPGTLYCFDKTGKKKWSVSAGDIPAHIVFLP
jgi:hypothetical protein